MTAVNYNYQDFNQEIFIPISRLPNDLVFFPFSDKEVCNIAGCSMEYLIAAVAAGDLNREVICSERFEEEFSFFNIFGLLKTHLMYNLPNLELKRLFERAPILLEIALDSVALCLDNMEQDLVSLTGLTNSIVHEFFQTTGSTISHNTASIIANTILSSLSEVSKKIQSISIE